MILKTIVGMNVVLWKIITINEWDNLSEGSRNIISYNGEWVFVKKVG